jgi:hypothetical protein
MDVCVCLLGADGRVVEGRINTLSATTARSARVRVPSGKGAHGCINVVVCVCECEVEWAWVAGERAPEPRSPVASPEKAKEQGNWYGKDSRPKGTVKSRMAKNGNGKLIKKKIYIGSIQIVAHLKRFCLTHHLLKSYEK